PAASPALSSSDSLPPPPPADDLELAAPPPSPPSDPSPPPPGDIDIPPPPPSIRPRLPSIASVTARPAKAPFAVEDEISWGGGETADMAAAVDAALLDDLVGMPPAVGRSEPGSTKPSSPSEAPPPSVDSLASLELGPPPSSRAGFGLEGGLIDRPPTSTSAPVPPPPPPSPPSARSAALAEAPPSSAVSAVASAAPASRPLSLARALGLGLGAALLVFAGGAFWLTRAKQLPPPTPSDLEAPTAAATASASASSSAAPEASASSSAEATASAEASAAPSAEATASAEASAAPSAEASAAPSAPPSAPAIDTSSLAPNEAILLVHFAANPAADVYFFARILGKVEQPITIPCNKPLFLRVGTQAKPSDPPLWLSAGRPYPVTCQKLNEFTIAGTP
ncbi:MAG: hypothetical protein FJ095_07940, partial [Deltaproteobacteria bacterium]|nr:hypothetical protein [Deltaproteobacteria bacterium]